MNKLSHWFGQFAKWAAHFSGHASTFGLAIGLIIVWLISGPMFAFNNTWQLVINTATTIITFLMVFLIQNTQNRDTGAIQTKLDELIRAIEGAHNALLDLEELDEAEIEKIRKDYRQLAADARKQLAEGGSDTACDEPLGRGNA
jgi:low affinity Fe/Cu permease